MHLGSRRSACPPPASTPRTLVQATILVMTSRTASGRGTSGPTSPLPQSEIQAGSRLPESLSAFAARILDQLSVSSWLPASVLVAGLFFILKAELNGCAFRATLADIGNTSASTIVLLGATVILSTTVTQAFEFGSIRLLEGYWGDGPVRSSLGRVFSALKLRRRGRNIRRRNDLIMNAFESARPGLLRAKVSPEVIAYIAADVRGEHPLPRLTPKQRAELNTTDWRTSASCELMRRVGAIEVRLDRTPKPHRIMPTRLGNTLRSYEDTANELVTGSVVGMVQRTYHLLPSHVQTELDQYRNRLGLYASLVAVSIALAGIALTLIAPCAPVTALLLSAGFGSGSAVFYGAAISSADAYGSLLVEAMHLATRANNNATGR